MFVVMTYGVCFDVTRSESAQRKRMNRLLLCPLGILVYTVLLTQAISCEQDGFERRPYTCVSCLEFTLQGALSFDSAPCTLTLVEDDTQLFRLRAYVRVLAQEEEINPDRFWIGYRHINATTIQDSGGDTVTSGPVTDGGNFAADSPGPAADVCVAVRSDGNFTRVPCSDELPFICHEVFAVPAVSVSGARFISDGGVAQLTCTGVGSLEWRRDGIGISGSANGIEISGSSVESNLTIASFDSSFVGRYECLASNAVGVAVSRAINLNLASAGSEGAAPTVSITQASDTQLGTTLSLNCTFPPGSPTVEWLLNGATVQGETAATLAVDPFSSPGLYQCGLTNANGDSSIASTNVCALDGVPGAMSDLAVSPISQTSVVVRWVPPFESNVEDSALLNYQLFYHEDTQDFMFDISNSQSPQDNSLVIFPDKSSPLFDFSTGEFEVTGLSVGTRYLFSAQASSSIGAGDLSPVSSVATYGLPPTDVLENTSASRTIDNKTLVVFWKPVDLVLPFGPLAKYQLQYRDFQKDFFNSVFVDPRFSFFVIQNLENAATYEVRVAAVVVVASNDQGTTETARNDFTEWVKVDGIITTVPSVPPTVIGPIQPSRANVIATAVVVPVVVVLLVLLVVGLVVLCLYKKNKGGKNSTRVRTESSAVELTRATDRSSPQPESDEKPPLSPDD